MSRPKFAPITSSLLARKGDARPWAEPGEASTPTSWRASVPQWEPSISSLKPAPELPLSEDSEPVFSIEPSFSEAEIPELDLTPAPGKPSGTADMKKCKIQMSFHDYKRLGIIAVKSGQTRQQLLQTALARFLASAVRRYGSDCFCLNKSDCGAQQSCS